MQNVYSKTLSINLKKIGLENIPEKYKEISQNRIAENEKIISGKIKYPYQKYKLIEEGCAFVPPRHFTRTSGGLEKAI